VAPLLLIQVGFTVPFFTSVFLLAPYWLSVLVCLIPSFLALDFAGKAPGSRSQLRMIAAVLGVVLLLIIPGVFVAY
jgi:hypothetical protein